MTPDEFRTQVLGVFPNARITSLQRSREHNADVGGVSNSDHLTGNAVDFVVPGMTAAEAAAKLRAAQVQNRVILDEGNHVHWSGPRDGGFDGSTLFAQLDAPPAAQSQAGGFDGGALFGQLDQPQQSQAQPGAAVYPGVVYSGFGANGPTPKPQADAFRTFYQAPGYDPKSEVGTNSNPYAEMQGRPVPEGKAYIDVGGQFHGIGKPDEGLGFLTGAAKPLDRVAVAAGQGVDALTNAALSIPGARQTNDFLAHMTGLPDTAAAAASGGATGLMQRNTIDDTQRVLREAAFQGRVPGKIGTFVGNVAGSAPLAALSANPLVGGALTGAALSDAKDAQGVARDAIFGAAGGKLGDVALNRIGGVVAPVLNESVQRLRAAGVPLTPGQLLGGPLRRMEDAATSFPFVGDAIKAAQRRGLTGFNRAAVNQAVTPIGETLPSHIRTGHDAVEWAANKVSDAYNTILPQLNIQVDPAFSASLSRIAQDASASLARPQAEQFQTILANQVTRHLPPPGVNLPGDAMKVIDSELGRLGRSYGSSAVAGERELGSYIGQTQTELRDLVTRTNPDRAPELQAINQSFARMLRVQNAASQTSAANGIFSAAQLKSATRMLDSSMRKSASAKGNAPMQDFAEAGQNVLPATVPDSGTPYRGLLSMGALGLGGSQVGGPVGSAAMATAAAGSIPMMAYSETGQKLIQALIAARPQSAPAIRAALTKLKTPAIVGGAAIPINARR